MSNAGVENSEVVFLVGAGISTPIGIPDMKGMYKAYMDKKQSGLSSIDEKTCQYFNQELKVAPDLEEFLLAANSIIDFHNSDLNQFVMKRVSKQKSSSKFKTFNEKLTANLDEIENVKYGILKFLSDTCFKFNREKALDINHGFVSALSKLGYPVYSTNYDPAFEHVAMNKGIRLNDNFIHSSQRWLWNEKIDFDQTNGFKLIKLHGSVTWYRDDSNTIEKIDYDTGFNNVGEEVTKIVIFPTKFKDIYEQNFFALYLHFLNSLAHSKVLIVAGHSLRDDYLRAGIVERKRKGGFQIIVVDPTYPTSIKDDLRPARLGKVDDVIHVPYTWEEFSDELSDIIINNTSATIVQRCAEIVKIRKYSKNKLKIRGNFQTLQASREKELSIDIKVYLALAEKPSRLRVWLHATYTDDNGIEQSHVYKNFIESEQVLYGNGLSRLVNENKVISIRVPEVIDWLKIRAKVVLNVGLVKADVIKPSNVKESNLIIHDKKCLSYK